MKKLMVLGATAAQIPFIQKAHELDCYVIVIDYNNEAPAIEYADEYIECSLLDTEKLTTICEGVMPDGITCGACDVGVRTAAVVCKKVNLPFMDEETANNVKDKFSMIETFRKNGVEHPEYMLVNKNEKDKVSDVPFGFPVITKPTNESASRGINVANNVDELQAAIEDSFKYGGDNVIIEEQMIGPEVSVEILVQNGKPYVLQITDKITTGAPHFVEIGHSQPSVLEENDKAKITDLAKRAAIAVGLKDAAAHAEIILTKDGPKMVEIAGRLGGGFITTMLLPLSTGISLAEYEIRRAIGNPKEFIYSDIEQQCVAIRFIGPGEGGVLKSISYDFDENILKNVYSCALDCRTGEKYEKQISNAQRLGHVICRGKTTKEALDNCQKYIKGIDLNFE